MDEIPELRVVAVRLNVKAATYLDFNILSELFQRAIYRLCAPTYFELCLIFATFYAYRAIHWCCCKKSNFGDFISFTGAVGMLLLARNVLQLFILPYAKGCSQFYL